MAGQPGKPRSAKPAGTSRLPPRLAAVADALPEDPSQVVADIGTGRAELAIHLAATGRARRVIAVDRSPKAVAIATELVSAYGLAGRVGLRVGDGPAAVSAGEADVLIVAGIGGRLMRSLLQRDAAGLAHDRRGPLLVLQPQSEPRLVREWAMCRAPELGYALVAEALVRDSGRYYHILTVRFSPPPPRSPAIDTTLGWLGDGFAQTIAEIGPLLLARPGPLLEGYLLWRAEGLSNLAGQAGKSGSPAGLLRARAACQLAVELRLAAEIASAHRAGAPVQTEAKAESKRRPIDEHI